ncbi:glycosyltransferase family 39 protein [Thalassoglobus sp. JC818]|uniref:glycosyltransferase family 39 protein n=1 Tax=Thalassoglobus sp. JC818 TaxID=3232136 RepID=UPI00345B0999
MRPLLSRSSFWLIGCLILCFIVRVGVVVFRSAELSDDPDSYIQLAEGLAAGRGFSTPGTDQATAFRPPFYPVLITPFERFGGGWGRGFLNVLTAVGGVYFIWRASQNLNLNPLAGLFASLVFGFDPLLVRYTSLSMTESLTAFLAATLIARLTDFTARSSASNFLTGLLFGITVLTRPTFWAFGGLIALWLCATELKSRLSKNQQRSARSLLFGGLGILLVVSPWVVRNWIAFGRPVLMTTHGGYTVLLGNNDAFYDEVVNQPLGTVWDGQHGPGQAVWAHEVNQEMDRLGLRTEIERDRWMSKKAQETIRRRPTDFLKSCMLRFLRFWNLGPMSPAAEGIPSPLMRTIQVYYAVLWTLMAVGILRIFLSGSQTWIAWGPVFCLVIAFTCVHLIYWSNARMRAPVMPAIALLSAAGVASSKSLRSTKTDPSQIDSDSCEASHSQLN